MRTTRGRAGAPSTPIAPHTVDNAASSSAASKPCVGLISKQDQQHRYHNHVFRQPKAHLCSLKSNNGDRLIYIEQKPTKAIERKVKIGTHWARVFYNGQELDREQITHTSSNQNKANDDTQTAVSTPTTESNMDFIDRAYEEHAEE
ncbi:hypothetical protein Bbelb_172700 [Branchiostoma belcheri]|nr:hypothetical protein Bbelb_172700 [Branchiostoma belcheri]